MEDLELIEYVNNNSLRSERIIRDRYNPLESLTDIDFIELYCLRKESVVELLSSGICTNPITNRSQPVPPAMQLCDTLNILGTGATLRKTAELLGMNFSTVHRFFWSTIRSLVRRAANY